MLTLNALNQAQEEIFIEIQETYEKYKALYFELLKNRLESPTKWDDENHMNEIIIGGMTELQGMRRLMESLGIISHLDNMEDAIEVRKETKKIIAAYAKDGCKYDF